MKLIKPVEFQTGHLISSNATETYSAWSSGTTYAKDAFVDHGTQIYQSLVNSNLNNQPDISPTLWQLVGPDNTHAMFDNQVSTQTSASSPLNVTIAPGVATNSLAFLNLENATSLVVNITDGPSGPNIYSKTIGLDDTPMIDWYMYFFEPYDLKTDVVLTDIPPYISSRITMNLLGSGTLKIGNFVYGNVYEIGGTQYGVTSGIRDFSVKQTDDFGNTTFVQRAYSKRMEAEVFIQNNQLNVITRLLTGVRSIPCVWIGSEDSQYANTLVQFGFYKDFNITINYPSYSLCSLQIEGLT